MKRRTIAVITGTRAEYGILTPVLRAIEAHPRLRLRLVVTGMHLQRAYGMTVREITRDGFAVAARVPVRWDADDGAAQAAAAGTMLRGFARAFARLRPDLVLLLGDRGEMLAAAQAACYLGIPAAHCHGGEVSGHIDDLFRHAVSKLAHLHFPATRGSARRLRGLGEEAWRITVAGAPALDRVLHEPLPAEGDIRRRYRLGAAPYLLVAQHPLAGEQAQAAAQMRATLAAVRRSGMTAVLILPNADAGGRAMRAAARSLARGAHWRVLASVPQADYLALLRGAAALVGNSSSGMIEAPALKVPVVNIGGRQCGRERGRNVIDAPPRPAAIAAALQRALTDARFRARVRRGRSPYGDGRAAGRIVRVLAAVPLDRRLREKRMTY